MGYDGGPNSGVMQLASTGFVSPTVTIFGGTFDTAGQNRSITTLTLGGGAAGSTASLQTGSGTATLGGTVTYTETNNPAGATIGGALNLGNVARTFAVGDSTAAAADLTVSAAIDGGGASGGLVKTGFGTLMLTGSNSFATKTLINEGVVQIDWINSSGNSPLGTNTTTDLGSAWRSGTLRWVGATSGTTSRTFNLSGTSGASIESSGAGALVLTGTVTATGASAKTLTLGGSGTAANAIGVIQENSSTNKTSVVKDGPGLWRIAAGSSYTGSFTVRNGTLVAGVEAVGNATGAFGGSTSPLDVLVGDSSPTASGTATLLLAAGVRTTKVMNVQAGGGSQAVVLGGEGNGAEFQGDAYLGRPVTLLAVAGGTTSFSGDFYGPGGPGNGPAVNIMIGSAGNTGVVSVKSMATTGAVGVQFGTLRLGGPGINTIGVLAPVSIGAATAGATLDLNGRLQTLANLSFTGIGGTLTDLVGGGSLVLANSGSAAAVGVTGTGHVLSAPVSLDDAATFTVASQGRLTVGGVIADGTNGPRGLVKAGPGTLVLGNANTFTGTTTVAAGTLRVGNGGTSGSVGTAASLALTGGQFVIDRSDTFTQAFAGTVISGNPSVAANAGNTLNFGTLTTLPGAVFDIPTTGSFMTSSSNVNGILPGGITYGGTTWAVANGGSPISGLAAFTLTSTAGGAAASYANANIDVNSSPSLSGPVAINSLRFAAATPTELTLSGSNTLAGGILVTPAVGATPSAISSGTLVASGGPLMVMQSNAAAALTIGAVIRDGTAATGLVKSGPGTLVLAAANTFTGTTTFDGTLQLGAGGTAGSIAGPLVGSAGSTLAFNRSNAVVQGTDFLGTIGGAIHVSQIGSGTLTLNGANTYTGTTSVNAGTLMVGNGATAGSIASSAAITGGSGGTLAFNRSNAVVQGTDFVSSITGGLGLTQAGSGTLTLSGTNTFSGPTRAAAGRINVSTALAVQNSTLDMNAADSGTFAFGQNSTVGGLTGSRNLDLGGVTLSVGNNGTNTTYLGGLSGGALTKVGSGMLALTGSNTYAGATTISGGTLAIGDGGTTGSLAGNVVNNAALAFNRSDAVTFSGAISGSGSLVKQGAGTLTLSGSSTYSGGSFISAGQVVATNSASLGTGLVTLAG
ncbi:MAG: beta strand repeat-containing protein, partial [Planctomycetia bacterium]